MERAFELWTAGARVWWPMATHSVSGRRDSVLVIEPGAGGRIYEQTAGGQEFPWGMVVVWEPPRRLVCDWLVGDTPTELEVRFAPAADGTVVEIEHRGWERFSIAPAAEGELVKSSVQVRVTFFPGCWLLWVVLVRWGGGRRSGRPGR